MSSARVWSLRRTFQRLHAGAIVRWLMRSSSQRFLLTAKPALIVAPHQDDETLGCGGLIALKRARGAAVQIVFLTDGARAPYADLNPAALIALRRGEAVEAAHLLGVEADAVHFLDFPDGRLSTLPKSMYLQLVERLRALLSEHRPEEVFVTHRRDCHPDHEAAYRLVREAIDGLGSATLELFEYSIWMLWSAPLFFRLKLRQLAGSRRLDIDAALGKKLDAIRAYRSQCATLPRGFLDRFQLPYEFYFPATEAR